MSLEPASFWLSLEAAERARRDREHITREVKVRPQYRTAGNDEPEPVSPADRALAESFAGEPYELKGAK